MARRLGLVRDAGQVTLCGRGRPWVLEVLILFTVGAVVQRRLAFVTEARRMDGGIDRCVRLVDFLTLNTRVEVADGRLVGHRQPLTHISRSWTILSEIDRGKGPTSDRLDLCTVREWLRLSGQATAHLVSQLDRQGIDQERGRQGMVRQPGQLARLMKPCEIGRECFPVRIHPDPNPLQQILQRHTGHVFRPKARQELLTKVGPGRDRLLSVPVAFHAVHPGLDQPSPVRVRCQEGSHPLQGGGGARKDLLVRIHQHLIVLPLSPLQTGDQCHQVRLGQGQGLAAAATHQPNGLDIIQLFIIHRQHVLTLLDRLTCLVSRCRWLFGKLKLE